MPFTLPSVFDFEIITFAPLLHLSDGVSVAAIGAVDKYNRYVYFYDSLYILNMFCIFNIFFTCLYDTQWWSCAKRREYKC